MNTLMKGFVVLFNRMTILVMGKLRRPKEQSVLSNRILVCEVVAAKDLGEQGILAGEGSQLRRRHHRRLGVGEGDIIGGQG